MVKVVLYYFDLAVEAAAAVQKAHVVLAAAVEAEEHRRPALVLEILLCPEEVVERVEVLIVAVERSCELSVLVVRLLEVLSRKHLEGWLGNRGYLISRAARQRRIQIESRLWHSHREILPIQQDMDDRHVLVDRHADRLSPSFLLLARRIPMARLEGIGGVSIL